MPSYTAFLGHQPNISLAELSAVLPDFSIFHTTPLHTVTFETQQTLTQRDLMQWGGTVVLAKSVTDAPVSLDDIPQLLRNEIPRKRGKVTFGLRTVGVSKAHIRRLLKECKQRLRREGIPSRYVGNDRHPAAPALLRDAGLIEGSLGCELTILTDEEWFWVGRTIAAQDPDAYTKRDMEKPARNTRAGLLPPKLAQVMLNLGTWLLRDLRHQIMDMGKADNLKSKVPHLKSLTILDPFSGMGVIPMECLLRQWSVLASDKASRAVEATSQNLDWLRREEKIFKKDVPSLVWQQDACKPFSLKEKPDLIVTETTLGPPLSSRPTIKEAKHWRAKNEELQTAFLENMAHSFPSTPLVCIWPVWYLSTGPLFLERAWKAVENAGFSPVLPPGISPDRPPRVSLLYRRPEQHVGREILLLKPKA